MSLIRVVLAFAAAPLVLFFLCIIVGMGLMFPAVTLGVFLFCWVVWKLL